MPTRAEVSTTSRTESMPARCPSTRGRRRCDHVVDPAQGMAAAADLDERADDRSHHVTQDPVAFDRVREYCGLRIADCGFIGDWRLESAINPQSAIRNPRYEDFPLGGRH